LRLHVVAIPASDAAPEDEPVDPPVEADPDDEPVDAMSAVDPDDPRAVPPVDEVPPAREALPPGPLLDPLVRLVPFPPDPLELPLPPGIDCRFEFDAHAAAPNALAAASKRMLRTTVWRMQGISGGEAFGITFPGESELPRTRCSRRLPRASR